uniref:Uncharacterized protein n=1 Tax=Myoviridae sp. ctOAa14 TaxID=2826646 RepID=A0A8S5MQS9_9CAUD|nr:MAG TPA: hypothetical protein [Myoviridae sp. ctOAa14]
MFYTAAGTGTKRSSSCPPALGLQRFAAFYQF